MTTALLTPQVKHSDRDGWTQYYGYGLWFRVEPDGTVQHYGKEGINAGVSAYLRHYPAQDLTVVILSNREDGVWEPMREIHRLVVEAARS